jgi:hypothetical protein
MPHLLDVTPDLRAQMEELHGVFCSPPPPPSLCISEPLRVVYLVSTTHAMGQPLRVCLRRSSRLARAPAQRDADTPIPCGIAPLFWGVGMGRPGWCSGSRNPFTSGATKHDHHSRPPSCAKPPTNMNKDYRISSLWKHVFPHGSNHTSVPSLRTKPVWHPVPPLPLLDKHCRQPPSKNPNQCVNREVPTGTLHKPLRPTPQQATCAK